MQVLDVMRYGQDMVMETARRYRPEDWSRVALGVWTAKDLLGHLSAFEVRMADVLATFVDEAPASDLMSADTETFNDDQAAIRTDWPIEQVLEEFTSAHARLMAHAVRIPAERWRELGTIPWYGADYSLDDLVIYQLYGHKREHDPQLSAALEGVPHA